MNRLNQMNKTRAAALIAVVGAAGVTLGAPAEAQAPLKFPSPSGKVVYAIKSSMVNGSQIMQWMEGGKKIRTESNMTLTQNGQTMPLKSWTILTNGFLYVYQPMTKQVMKMKAPKEGKGGGVPGMGPVGTDALKQGKVTGKETIAGKPCEVRQVNEQLRASLWKGLPLKMIVTTPMAGQMTVLATKVEVPANLQASAFKLPAGVKVVEGNPAAMGMPGGGSPRPGTPPSPSAGVPRR